MEMGCYFGHTYNMPFYKIPVPGGVPVALPNEPDYIGRHQLYDLDQDPQQLTPLDDPALEAHFVARVATHLRAYEAPPEQYLRLGIPSP
jgi:hypothetical protein